MASARKKLPLSMPPVPPVFTADEWISAQPDTPRATAFDRLRRARQRGFVKAIGSGTGVYAVVPPGVSAEAYVPDKMVAASKLLPDCPVAYHSALEVLGRAHSVGMADITMLCTKQTPPRRLGPWSVKPVRAPRALRDKNAANFGVTKFKRQDGEALVTNASRTLVDCLDRLELGGGFEEVVLSLESYPTVDFDEILAYLDLLGSPTTVARVGYALDAYAERLYFTDEVQSRFRDRLPSRPVYLRRETPTRLVAKWRLLVPERLLPEEWEE